MDKRKSSTTRSESLRRAWVKLKASGWVSPRKGISPSNLASINANKKGSGNPMWGKKGSQKQKDAVRKFSLGRKKSDGEIRKISEANRWDNAQNWKGDKASYSSVHKWVRKWYGKANKCENPECIYPRRIAYNSQWLQKPKRYVWANKDHEYRRVRKDWIMFCDSCHSTYDRKYLKGVRTKS